MPDEAGCEDAAMRVLIAPDKFAGTLTAVQAAEAIAAGWRRHAPGDDLDLAPMADGGPGFVDVLHAALGGELAAVTVSGPHGDPVPAVVLRVGETAYVESAQAAGLHLVHGSRRPPRAAASASSSLAAAAGGARTVVVGLGGSGTNDGGAGVLAALGATSDGELDGGAAGLASVTSVDVSAARAAARRRDARRGQRRRHPPDRAVRRHQDLRPAEGDRRGPDRGGRRLARGVRHRPPTGVRRWRRVPAPPEGSATPCSCSARTASPASTWSRRRSRWPSRARSADLVVTGEGAFDFSSRAGKVPYGVAGIASEALRPCIVLAGSVLVGSREMRALGVESAYSLVELVGEERALAAPADALADLAARVARTWSR